MSGFKDNSSSLQHWKYVSRKRVGDKWVYEYADDKKYNSHRGALENYAQRGTKYSRNMPGGSTDSGKGDFSTNKNRMTLPQITAAKKAGAAVRDAKVKQQAEKDAQTLRKHAYTLKYKQRENAVSRNIPTQNNSTKPANTLSKKDIKQAVFKSKVNVLKREAKEAIDRAKKWLDDLFD